MSVTITFGATDAAGATSTGNVSATQSTGFVWPDATNTGYAPGTVLKTYTGQGSSSGDHTMIDKPGTYDSYHFTPGTGNELGINASNVTITNSLISGAANQNGVHLYAGALNFVMANSTITGANQGDSYAISADGSSNAPYTNSCTIHHCNIGFFAKAFYPTLGIGLQEFYYNFCHDLGDASGQAHINAVYVAGWQGPSGSTPGQLYVHDNFFKNGSNFCSDGFGPIWNYKFDHNWSWDDVSGADIEIVHDSTGGGYHGTNIFSNNVLSTAQGSVPLTFDTILGKGYGVQHFGNVSAETGASVDGTGTIWN